MNYINELKKCNKCGKLPKLIDNSIQIGKTNFIIIGESPAKDGWIKSGKAFYNTQGKLQGSGKVLERLLKILDLKIEDIYFTECCKCLIERKNFNICSSNCKELLIKQLNDTDCGIILPMGAYPTSVLLETKIDKLGDVVGKIFEKELGNRNYKIIPIYHPSPLNPKGYKGNVPIFENLKEIIKSG